MRTEHEEGRRAREQEIALSMLQEGINVDLIARTTELQHEDIEALRESISGK